MNRIQKITTITLGVAALGTAGLVVAARGGHDMSRMIERAERHLELDANQSDALQEFVSSMQRTRELMRPDELHRTASELLQADTLDQGAALTLIETRADALRAQAPDLVAAAATFFDGLDDGQRDRIRTLADHRHEGSHGKHRWHRDD